MCNGHTGLFKRLVPLWAEAMTDNYMCMSFPYGCGTEHNELSACPHEVADQGKEYCAYAMTVSHAPQMLSPCR